MQEQTPKKYMSTKEVLSYGLGLMGFQFVVGYVTTYQAQFFNRTMAANFALVGIIILIAKVASAVIDPFIGNWIDRTNSKWGKLKPFILYSIIPYGLLTILIFCPFPGIEGTALYFYIFATYFLWCIAMTVGDVPSQAIASVMTPNTDERNKVVSLSNTLKAIGLAASNVLVPIVTLFVPGGAHGFSGTMNGMEYFWSALIVGLVGCAMFALIFFNNKERIPYHVERMNLRQMFDVVKGNKYMIIVVLSFFLGFGRIAATAIQAQTAGAIMGSETQVLFLGITTAAGSMISMILSPILLKKFDERKVFVAMAVYTFITSVISCAFAFTLGYSGAGLAIMYVVMFLRGLGFGSYYILPMILVADAVDYYEYKTGKRTEGVSYAVLSFCIKVTMAIGAAVALALVSVAGYDSNVPFEQITKRTKDWVFFAYIGMPGICYLLSAIPMLRYDLVGKKKAEIQAELLERRKARAGAESGEDEPSGLVSVEEVETADTEITEVADNETIEAADDTVTIATDGEKSETDSEE